MTDCSDYWPICVDLDSAQEEFDNKCKKDQLLAWKGFQKSLNSAIRGEDVPKVYIGNLTPHQIESIQESSLLKSRFRIDIDIEDQHCYLYRI